MENLVFLCTPIFGCILVSLFLPANVHNLERTRKILWTLLIKNDREGDRWLSWKTHARFINDEENDCRIEDQM